MKIEMSYEMANLFCVTISWWLIGAVFLATLYYMVKNP